jgi:dipeptidyl aminopeptidase/acylaminoacyl peptidase
MPRSFLGLLVLWAVAAPATAQDTVSFSTHIQPLLRRHCVGCHQPQSKQAGLLLTSYDGFRNGGRKGPSFVPGNPEASLLLDYLTGKIKPQMPFGAKPLADAEIDLFRRWIRDGARNDATAEIPASAENKPVVYNSAPPITAFTFAPGGKTIAVAGYREILLVDVEGTLLARLPGLSKRIHSLAFTPDGKTLAAVGGDPARFGEVQIWDLDGRRQRYSIVVGNDTLFGGSLSPDGKLLACGSADKSIRIFDIDSGKEVRKMDHHEDWVLDTVWGLDGLRLVSVGRDRAAKMTEVATGRFIENVNLLREPLTAVVRHPKRDWILTGGAERIPYLYRMDRPRAMRIADDSTLIRKFDKQDGPILAVAFSPNGDKIAVAAETGGVRIYDADSGALLTSCRGHEGGTYALAFSPDGASLATGGYDGTLRFFDRSGTVIRAFVAAPVTTVAQRN